jgi:hypothetical protein
VGTTLAALGCLPGAEVRAQLGEAGSQELREGSAGLPGTAEAFDRFGHALATGDFNGDGRVDLAVGVSDDDVDPFGDVGSVTVIYGTAAGLDPASGESWSLLGVAGEVAADEDGFGSALAAADFDGDGFDDLAIGVPFRDVVDLDLATWSAAGAVVVLYGSLGGIEVADAQYLHQGDGNTEGVPEEHDHFGSALAAGDFDGDGIGDLAIGVPDEDVGAISGAGAVNVIYGSFLGLGPAGGADDIWTQGALGTSDDEQLDLFGSALAAGDLDGDGRDDLAVGAPNETWIDVAQAGAVFVIRSSPTGLVATGTQVRSQDHPSLDAVAEPGDKFGASLAIADFDGDGVGDLAIGSPGEAPPAGLIEGGLSELAGVVHVVAGVAGLGVGSTQLAKIDRADLGAGAPLSGDQFGAALAAGRFGPGAAASLVIGAPGLDVGGLQGVGATFVIPGTELGSPSAVQTFSQQGGVAGVPEEYDFFGSPLAAGDFDGNGFDDLAIGVPNETVGAELDAGAVVTLYDTGLFRDGFELASADRWSAVAP